LFEDRACSPALGRAGRVRSLIGPPLWLQRSLLRCDQRHLRRFPPEVENIRPLIIQFDSHDAISVSTSRFPLTLRPESRICLASSAVKRRGPHKPRPTRDRFVLHAPASEPIRWLFRSHPAPGATPLSSLPGWRGLRYRSFPGARWRPSPIALSAQASLPCECAFLRRLLSTALTRLLIFFGCDSGRCSA
jgi:hypothetical protein